MHATPPEPASALPAKPVSPRVFVEDVIPALFADLDLPAEAREVELRLGIVLEGPEGGSWTLHFIDGELGIAPERDLRADATLIQRVDDWRAALWEGRPAFVWDALAALFGEPGEVGWTGSSARRQPGMVAPALDPVVVEELRSLRGRVEIRVEAPGTGGPGDGPRAGIDGGGADAWRVAVQLGPGPIEACAAATVSLAADQAEAIRRGELHPIEALITGELRLEGDLGLILQLQALALRATLPRSTVRSR